MPPGATSALGVEHILLGIDHLLFVLGLLLIVRGPWMLIKTITAFTLAHSLTLALATLGLVDRAGRPGRCRDRAQHRLPRRRDPARPPGPASA